MSTTKEQLRRQAILAAYDQSRDVLTGISVMKRHPIEVGADAALEVAWQEIERLRAEVNEYAAFQWNERDAGTISEWQPPYPGVGEFGQPDDEALQQQADMAREDWQRERDKR